jgi:hypothetical protein
VELGDGPVTWAGIDLPSDEQNMEFLHHTVPEQRKSERREGTGHCPAQNNREDL